MSIKFHDPDIIESFMVQITEAKYPQAFERMVDNLVNSGLPLDEAKKAIEGIEVEMELYYSPNLGLFSIESEPIECGANIVDPYTGDEMVVTI